MFRTVLKFSGFDVREAGDGFDALNILEQHRVDLVVLDLGLPRLDGLAVHAEISAHAITRHIPIVIVTGEDRDLTQVKAACVLKKPVTSDQLVMTVRRCLATGGGHADFT